MDNLITYIISGIIFAILFFSYVFLHEVDSENKINILIEKKYNPLIFLGIGVALMITSLINFNFIVIMIYLIYSRYLDVAKKSVQSFQTKKWISKTYNENKPKPKSKNSLKTIREIL